MPVHYRGSLRAAFGLDFTRSERRWGSNVGTAMLKIADVIGEVHCTPFPWSPGRSEDRQSFPPGFLSAYEPQPSGCAGGSHHNAPQRW